MTVSEYMLTPYVLLVPKVNLLPLLGGRGLGGASGLRIIETLCRRMEHGQQVLPIGCNYLSCDRVSLHQIDVDETLLDQGKGKFADLFRKQDVNSRKRNRLDDLYPDKNISYTNLK